MKLCIPSREANGLESATEPHFPSASHLIVFDTESRQDTVISVGNDQSTGNTQVDAVLCASISRAGLHGLLGQGIAVYGTNAATVSEAIAQFERGELVSVDAARGCDGKGHDNPDHECCGGQGHGHDDDHECCGGKGHDDPDHECCGGQGHGHGGCGGRRHPTENCTR